MSCSEMRLTVRRISAFMPDSRKDDYLNDNEQSQQDRINVLVVEPGFLPYEKEINGLRDMQELVGGSIQAIYPFKETVALVCNEEGILQHLEFNRSIPERGYGGIFGTFFVCGLGEEDFTSLTPEQVKTYTARFKKAEIFIAMNGDKPFTIRIDASPKYPLDKPKHSQKPPKR